MDEKYETIGEGNSKKENVLIMTPQEITEIKQHAEAIAAILYAQTNAAEQWQMEPRKCVSGAGSTLRLSQWNAYYLSIFDLKSGI